MRQLRSKFLIFTHAGQFTAFTCFPRKQSPDLLLVPKAPGLSPRIRSQVSALRAGSLRSPASLENSPPDLLLVPKAPGLSPRIRSQVSALRAGSLRSPASLENSPPDCFLVSAAIQQWPRTPKTMRL